MTELDVIPHPREPARDEAETHSLIAFRITDHAARLVAAESQIVALGLTAQRLDLDAVSRDRTVVATAAALKDAKDAAEATARAEVAKSNSSWSPFSKMLAIASVVIAVVVAWRGGV